MSGERLLKRLRHWERGDADKVSRLDAGEFTKSVLADIELLYNTKRGTVLVSDEMGLPDFTGLLNRFGPQEVTTMENAFREVTEKHEPRIRGVSVRFLPRENEYGVLRFLVAGILIFRNQPLPIEFNALVQGNGSVAIEA